MLTRKQIMWDRHMNRIIPLSHYKHFTLRWSAFILTLSKEDHAAVTRYEHNNCEGTSGWGSHANSKGGKAVKHTDFGTSRLDRGDSRKSLRIEYENSIHSAAFDSLIIVLCQYILHKAACERFSYVRIIQRRWSLALLSCYCLHNFRGYCAVKYPVQVAIDIRGGGDGLLIMAGH